MFIPLGGSSIYAAWRTQYLRRLTGPAFTPLGGPSIHAAWREPSVYPAWRTQHLRRLTGPAFTPLDGPSNDAAWRAQHLRRLADPVMTPLGEDPVFIPLGAGCNNPSDSVNASSSGVPSNTFPTFCYDDAAFLRRSHVQAADSLF